MNGSMTGRLFRDKTVPGGEADDPGRMRFDRLHKNVTDSHVS